MGIRIEIRIWDSKLSTGIGIEIGNGIEIRILIEIYIRASIRFIGLVIWLLNQKKYSQLNLTSFFDLTSLDWTKIFYFDV